MPEKMLYPTEGAAASSAPGLVRLWQHGSEQGIMVPTNFKLNSFNT